MKKLYEGISILLKYIPPDDDGDVYAEHDQIWCSGPKKDELSEDDASRLRELGWFIDRNYDCWSHFV